MTFWEIVGIFTAFKIVHSCLVTSVNRATFQDLKDVIRRMKPGDLLEINRGWYSHYALYLGNNEVLNVNAEDKNETKARIQRKPVAEVCGGSLVRIRNHDDVADEIFQTLPRSEEKILKQAKKFENKVVPYGFFARNCEYYCTLWRFGKGFSTQVAEPTKGSAFALAMEIAIEHFSVVLMLVEPIMQEEAYSKYKNICGEKCAFGF